jgi:hypothetical protein
MRSGPRTPAKLVSILDERLPDSGLGLLCSLSTGPAPNSVTRLLLYCRVDLVRVCLIQCSLPYCLSAIQ